MNPLDWPSLPYNDWKETYETLHMYTQVVGKVALKLNPVINHWWECSLRVYSRGLRTPNIYFGGGSFEIAFDFIDHTVIVSKSDGNRRLLSLNNKPVSEFYKELMDCFKSLQIKVEIDRIPSEVPHPIPLDEDKTHHVYQKEFAYRHWQILVQTDRILTCFRAPFLGKASPVQFWWGSFDLAVTLFSGRKAPPRPEADHITQQAYSHEVYSCGFWPGSGNILEPAFYCYMAPEPPGFKEIKLDNGAFYNEPSKGYVLRYDEIRKSGQREDILLEFLRKTYARGIELAHWDPQLTLDNNR